MPFTAETVQRYANDEPTQAAGAGLLRLAWRHRPMLLDSPRTSTACTATGADLRVLGEQMT